MVPHAQSMTTSSSVVLPSIICSSSPNLPLFSRPPPPPKSLILKSLLLRPLRCSVSVLESNTNTNNTITKTIITPAEVSRTIMELSSVGTFSTATQEEDTWPLAVGVRFAIDPQQGTPIICLSASHQHFNNSNSTLNVQLDQCGLRTTQCTIQGTLHRPHDHIALKKLESLWEKRFREKADNNFIHILQVERVLQMDNFMEDGVWVTSSDYRLANADPLRDCAEQLVHEINTNNMEDVLRFCNVYVESDVQVSEAKMVWVDRLGFDIHIYSPQNDVFEVRIPFPREVTGEKGAKSSFNGMSQLAWEVERNYCGLEFEKVKHLKKIASKIQ